MTLQSEILTQTILQQSGSELVFNRNTNSIQAISSDSASGYVFAPSKKQIFNIDELKKTIDINVSELLPPTQEQELDLVPRQLYIDSLEALAIAQTTIESQSEVIGELEAKLSELENRINSLNVELDNEKLLRIISEDNTDNIKQQIALINDGYQTALQRATIESISKTAAQAKVEGLTAQVEALKLQIASLNKEIDQLNKTIQGKDSQLIAGAKSGTEITVRVVKKQYEDQNDIYVDASNSGNYTWRNGPDIELYNFTSVDQKISFDISQVATPEGKWIQPLNDLILKAGEKQIIQLQLNTNVIHATNPNGPAEKPKHRFGTFTITSNSSNVVLTTTLYKTLK